MLEIPVPLVQTCCLFADDGGKEEENADVSKAGLHCGSEKEISFTREGFHEQNSGSPR